jgi:hypothetical protein
VTYLHFTVGVDPEGVQTVVEFMRNKGIPLDLFVDGTIS